MSGGATTTAAETARRSEPPAATTTKMTVERLADPPPAVAVAAKIQLGSPAPREGYSLSRLSSGGSGDTEKSTSFESESDSGSGSDSDSDDTDSDSNCCGDGNAVFALDEASSFCCGSSLGDVENGRKSYPGHLSDGGGSADTSDADWAAEEDLELCSRDVPTFAPLHDEIRDLSFSAFDEPRPALEVVPTGDVEQVTELWRERRTRRQMSGYALLGYSLRRAGMAQDASRLSAPIPARRNRSDGSCAVGCGSLLQSCVGGGVAHRRHKGKSKKYGMPTGAHLKPSDIVTKSSKKIHAKHARYALTAGMMLGIRESVGGGGAAQEEEEIERWMCLEGAAEGLGRHASLTAFQRSESERLEEDAMLRHVAATGIGFTSAGGGSGDDDDDGDATKTLSASTGPMERRIPPKDAAANPLSQSCPVPSSPSKEKSAREKRLRAKQQATTLVAECERVTKYKFPPNQFYLGTNRRPLPHRYKFKVYSPLIFARIRSIFGVQKQTFLHSICGQFNFYEFASNAKSGQFFFYSHDGRYMIKTLTPAESKLLREILPFYYRHLTRYPDSFLTHFYGMYRVCMPDFGNRNQRLHFVIMRSVFNTEKKINRVWDLKGSTAGRKAKKGDSVQKDLDILEERRKLRFEGGKHAFLDQLRKDATFLARLGIMDYSLLLGVHESNDEEETEDESSAANDVVPSSEAPSVRFDATAASSTEQSEDKPQQQQRLNKEGLGLSRTNTPFRRQFFKRNSFRKEGSNGAAKDSDGFHDLQELDRVMEEKAAKKSNKFASKAAKRAMAGSSNRVDGDDGNVVMEGGVPARRNLTPKSAKVMENGGASKQIQLVSHPELSARSRSSSSSGRSQKHGESSPPNFITSRTDLGIEGFGGRAEDGILFKREIYFCGIIDILQYYNARKLGETVIRKAAGSSANDISCVDPETYGKRFVKFIDNLIE